MIYTSIKQLKIAADFNYADLSLSQLIAISKKEIKEIACHCQYGYTNASLFETCIGTVFCESYIEYCHMLAINVKKGA